MEHKEVRTLYYGDVHSLCPRGEFKLYAGIKLFLSKSIGDYELYIYPEGYEFWFNMPELTNYLNPVKIDAINNDGMIGASMFLSEEIYQHMNKDGSPCTTYSDNEKGAR